MDKFFNELQNYLLTEQKDRENLPENNNPSKKRKAEEISPNPSNPYEDANKELRELHMLRRMRREETKESLPEESQQKNEKIFVNFQAPKNVTNLVEEAKVSLPELVEKIKVPLPVIETIKPQPTVSKDTPMMWISRLKNYPNDYLKKNMITFDQLVSEDLSGRKNAKQSLQVAFMSTFGFSMDILEPLLQQGTRLILADDWKTNPEPKIERNFYGYPNFTLIRSPKDPTKNYQGTFHSKLWLLKFPTFLRVVIGSGNLTSDDWSILSNCVWFKDFPKKSTLLTVPEAKQVPKGEFDYTKDFINTLTSFVQAIMPTKDPYPNLLNINIDDYFISDIDIVLIPSIPGRHSGEDLDKYGHKKISAVLKKIVPSQIFGTSKPKKHIMTYQTSSVGNLNEVFLKEILSSFLLNYATIEDLKAGQKKKNAPPSTIDQPSSRVKLVFPTKEYVENCNEGPQSAYCLVLNKNDYEKETFPKGIFHQFQAHDDYYFHEGIVPHLKVFVVTEENGEINDDSYIYFGSHNFSASAWGRYENSCSRLSIYNTELGILFPPAKGSKEKKQDIIDHLPLKFPPVKYRSNQVPWTITFGFQ